jgi:hypothetical protein
LDDFVAQVNAIAPDFPIWIQVRPRPDEPGNGPRQMATTKRQSPALSLFASARPPAEWVLWMPQGYYDTSIAGDGKYLGWHLNPSSLDQPRPTAYYPIKQFQNRLYRKDILKKLLETADPNVALGLAQAAPEPAKTIAANRPPSIAVEIRATPGNRADIHILAEGAPGKKIKETLIRNGVWLERTIVHPPGTASYEDTLHVLLASGGNRWSATTVDSDGLSQTRWAELDSDGTPDRPPRLLILTFGAEAFQVDGAEKVVRADRDARDLAVFFKDHLVAPGRGNRFGPAEIESHVLSGPQARAVDVLGKLRDVNRAPLGREDLAVVVVESHLVGHEGQALLLGADSQAGKSLLPTPAINTDELGTALGEIAASGCKVILLLDVVHKIPGETEADALKAWIRDLRDRHSVITLLASRTRPSEPTLEHGQWTFSNLLHRILAQGVLNSTSPRWQTRNRVNAQGNYSLHGFQEAVLDIVREFTQERFDAACYIPELISEDFPLLAP